MIYELIENIIKQGGRIEISFREDTREIEVEIKKRVGLREFRQSTRVTEEMVGAVYMAIKDANDSLTDFINNYNQQKP